MIKALQQNFQTRIWILLLTVLLTLISCKRQGEQSDDEILNLLIGEWLYTGTFIGDSMLTDTLSESVMYIDVSGTISKTILIQDSDGFRLITKDSLGTKTKKIDYAYKREYILRNDTLDELYYGIDESGVKFDDYGSPSLGYYELKPENDTIKLIFHLGDDAITKFIKSIDEDELIFDNTKFITRFKRL